MLMPQTPSLYLALIVNAIPISRKKIATGIKATPPLTTRRTEIKTKTKPKISKIFLPIFSNLKRL